MSSQIPGFHSFLCWVRLYICSTSSLSTPFSASTWVIKVGLRCDGLLPRSTGDGTFQPLCALRLCITVHTSPIQPCLLPLLYMNLLLDLGLFACLLSWGRHQLSSTTNTGLPKQIKSFTLIKFFPDERRQRNHASASLYSFCPNSVSHLWIMGLPVTLAHSCSTDASTRQAAKKKGGG